MSSVRTCPECREQFHLRGRIRDGWIHCPTCDTSWPLESAEANRVDARSKSTINWGLIGIIVVLVIAGVLVKFLREPKRPLAPNAGQKEDKEVRRDDIREALVQLKPLSEEEMAEEIKPVFGRLSDAARDHDAAKLAEIFDGERMCDELLAAVPELTSKEKKQIRRGFKDSFLKNLLDRRAMVLQWTKVEIRGIKKRNEAEAVLIVRHENPGLGTDKMRWWLTRQSGQWRIYDFENLEMGIRMSAIVSTMLQQGPAQLSQMTPTIKTLGAAIDDMLAQNVDGAERKLNTIAIARLPAELDAVRHYMQGAIHSHRDRFKKALAEFDVADRLRPESPGIDLMRGIVFNKMREFEKAREHLEKYHKLLGDDAISCSELAFALHNLRRFKEASPYYRKALDLEPKNENTFFLFIRTLGQDDDMSDVGQRFARLDNPQQNFEKCAADCVEPYFDVPLLGKLLEAMRAIDPEYAPVHYYTSLTKARSGQTDEAVKSFKRALSSENREEKRKEYPAGFLKAMAAAGQWEVAYKTAPAADESFALLAQDLLKRYQFDPLQRLVAMHAKSHAGDPLLPWYQAAVYSSDERYALAEKTFAAAMKRPPNQETLKLFRSSRITARYHSGAVLSAYRDIEPCQESFVQLANLCSMDGDDEGLEAILDAYEKTEPNSIDVLCHRLSLKCRRNQLEEATELLKSALAKKPPMEERTRITNHFFTKAAEAGKSVEAYRSAPDASEAFRSLAAALEELDREEQLQKLIEAHEARHPTDPWIAVYRAGVHQDHEAWDKVVAILAPLLKSAPADVDEHCRWRLMFAMYKSGRGLQAYADSGVNSRDANFSQLANLMLNDKKGAELQALVDARRKNAAGAELDFFEAMARILANKPAEAAALMQKATSNAKESWQRTNYEFRFLSAMAEAGHVPEAFRAVTDRSQALATLGRQLVNLKKDKELEALLKEYGDAAPAETAQEYFKGELSLLRGDAKAAEVHFAAAMALDSKTSSFTYSLKSARVKLGNALRVFHESDRGRQSFETLAYMCIQEKDAGQLQGLIDDYRCIAPDDPILTTWDVDLLWLKKDYEQVLKHLEANRDELLGRIQTRSKCESYLVRSLIRLKRTEQAIKEAEALCQKRSSDAVLLILAYAATGDTKKTLAALSKRRDKQYLVGRCYADEDLGPILRSKEFQSVADAFPEPKKKRFDSELD